MKNAQSKIKPIKIGKQPGTTWTLIVLAVHLQKTKKELKSLCKLEI